MNFRRVDKLLRKDGWKLVRVTGSHHQYKKEGVATLAVVPNHNGKDLSKGVLKSLTKITGLPLKG